MIGLGQMAGRILAVNSVDRLALETTFKKEYEKQVDEAKKAGKDPNTVKEAWQRQRPFLSGNDRSRWMTVRALVEKGTYAIDDFLIPPNWDTIDMVKHAAADGVEHLYSSKPPLLATLMAGEYWLIYKVTGWTLGDHPYEIGRFMLLTTYLPGMLLYFILLAKLAERYATTDWAKIFVVTAGVFATFLTTFVIVFNNHTPAAVAAMISLYAALRIWFDGERRARYFFLFGLFGAFTVVNELPALAYFAIVSAGLLFTRPRESLVAWLPGAAIVIAGFFGTNYAAHGIFSPPYTFRSDAGQSVLSLQQNSAGMLSELGSELPEKRVPLSLLSKLSTLEQLKEGVSTGSDKWEVTSRESKEPSVKMWWLMDKGKLRMYSVALSENSAEVQLWHSWYHFVYERGKPVDADYRILPSYWFNPGNPIDKGEPNITTYALQVLVGHHGIFSLTPIWLLSLIGLVRMNRWQAGKFRQLAVMIGVVSMICLTFYIALRPQEDRNYGGTTAGFRWAFWFAPLWLTAMLPALDGMSTSRRWRIVCLTLLGLSVLSVAYPTWNPWTSPWLMNGFQWLAETFPSLSGMKP